MPVRCSEWERCPVEDCPHKEEHSHTITFALLPGKPLLVETFCDVTERLCGERYPKEKITVVCWPVEGEKCLASMHSGHPGGGLDFKDQDAVIAEKAYFNEPS